MVPLRLSRRPGPSAWRLTVVPNASCFRVVRGVVETQQHIDAATRANRPIGASDPVASDEAASGY
jgi:hypothetical protein